LCHIECIYTYKHILIPRRCGTSHEPSVMVVPEPTPLQLIGVLHDAVADSITAGHVALSPPRRTLNTSPLPLATTPRSPTATFQIRPSLEFWIPIAVFKHRWRWKFSWWWPTWVPITGGTSLRYLSRKKPTFGNPDLSPDPCVNDLTGTCFA